MDLRSHHTTLSGRGLEYDEYIEKGDSLWTTGLDWMKIKELLLPNSHAIGVRLKEKV